MRNRKVIITGVGYKSNSGDIMSADTKINIGFAIAKALVANNIDVILVSKTQSKLVNIRSALKEWYPNSLSTIQIFAVNLLNVDEVDGFVKTLSNEYEYNLVLSTGLSAGNYHVDNPYLRVEKVPESLPILEFESVVLPLLNLTKALLPFFKEQKETRVVVINSMSSIRPYPLGFSHSSAKAGLHNAVRSLSLELTPQNIYFSEINPGMVDTGGYDGEEVKDSIRIISKAFGYEYDELPLMPPESVAEAVMLCLESKAHILNIDLVSQGQIPHLGA